MSLDEEHKEFKPDYGVFANGLSRKFVVLVAEFKPPEGRQQQESDFIKIGKELRIMLNRLLSIGIHDAAVCGILVYNNRMSTFKMELRAPQLYTMVQLSNMPIIQSSEDLSLLPPLVSKLHQLKVSLGGWNISLNSQFIHFLF